MAVERHSAVRRRVLGLVALVTCALGADLVAAPVATAAASLPATSGDAPDEAPGDALSGTHAVRTLSAIGSLDDTARSLRSAAGELVEALQSDPALFVVPGRASAPARIGVLDRLQAAPANWTHPAELPPTTLTVEQARDLHSRPDSKLTILLDLNGHVTTGTLWNALSGIPEITSAPYDRDGKPGGSWSELELAEIEHIWRVVAEDFAPFDVDVTTKDPGLNALSRSGAGDQKWGVRVVISATKGWMPELEDLGGIAELGSFGTTTPVFSFVVDGLRNHDIGTTASHEVGHALGLFHDGLGSSDYHLGVNDWGPIMGSAGNVAMQQWSNGDYAGATNTEDDLATIAEQLAPIVDDHGDTGWSSTIVPSATTLAGMMGAGGDVDAFVTSVGDGPLSATVRAADTDTSNLLARVTVRDVAGNVVATNAPVALRSGVGSTAPLDWSATATAIVTAGVYTIEVEPSGLGALDAGGFSGYGAHGRYVLDIAGATPPPGAPPTTRPPAPRPAPGEDATTPVRFTPVVPGRLADTREGAPATRLAAGGVLRIQVAGRAGVPVDASAAALNVVAVDPAAPGYLTAYPCTTAVPLVATVNHGTATLANATIATLAPSGEVCVFAYAATDVVVDVTGWFSPGAESSMSLRATRVLDTRNGTGGAFRAAAGSVTPVQIPGSPRAVAMNVTAVEPTADGFLTFFPCGAERPLAAGVNFAAGEIRPNNAIVATGTDGSVCIYAHAETDIVVDLTGVFSPTAELWYLPAAPQRLEDTRALDLPARPGAPVVYGTPPSPTGERVRAVSVNIAATEHNRPGYVTTFVCGGDRPDTAAVSTQVGETNSNGAIAPVRDDLSCLYAYTRTHLIVDLLGWWISG